MAPTFLGTNPPQVGALIVIFVLFVVLIPAWLIATRTNRGRFQSGCTVTILAAVFYLVISFILAAGDRGAGGLAIAGAVLFVLALLASPFTGAMSAIIGAMVDKKTRRL